MAPLFNHPPYTKTYPCWAFVHTVEIVLWAHKRPPTYVWELSGWSRPGPGPGVREVSQGEHCQFPNTLAHQVIIL